MPHANVAGLTDRAEVQIWSASRNASEQQLSGPDCGKLREQSMKLHTVNVGRTLQKE